MSDKETYHFYNERGVFAKGASFKVIIWDFIKYHVGQFVKGIGEFFGYDGSRPDI